MRRLDQALLVIKAVIWVLMALAIYILVFGDMR